MLGYQISKEFILLFWVLVLAEDGGAGPRARMLPMGARKPLHWAMDTNISYLLSPASYS